MTRLQKKLVLALRIALGLIMLSAGIQHVSDPLWSASSYLQNAQTFAPLYHWFASPTMLPLTNFANEWLLILVGLSLISGLFLGGFSIIGLGLMLLYYFPVLQFPFVGPAHAFLIDEHIIFALLFLFFATKHLKLYETEHARHRALRMAERGV